MIRKQIASASARRWMHFAFLLLISAIGVLRFVHLSADFPNDTPWMIDQAKFTDEGWWSSGAVMHMLTGHWYRSGDYNPAVALPVWPLLLSAVFQFTGVSVVAARALNVSISLASMGLVYLLVRRFTRPGARRARLRRRDPSRPQSVRLRLLSAGHSRFARHLRVLSLPAGRFVCSPAANLAAGRFAGPRLRHAVHQDNLGSPHSGCPLACCGPPWAASRVHSSAPHWLSRSPQRSLSRVTRRLLRR